MKIKKCGLFRIHSLWRFAYNVKVSRSIVNLTPLRAKKIALKRKRITKFSNLLLRMRELTQQIANNNDRDAGYL